MTETITTFILTMAATLPWFLVIYQYKINKRWRDINELWKTSSAQEAQVREILKQRNKELKEELKIAEEKILRPPYPYENYPYFHDVFEKQQNDYSKIFKNPLDDVQFKRPEKIVGDIIEK